MRNIYIFCFSILFVSAHVGAAEYAGKHLEDFNIPDQFISDVDFHPLGYLETYPVEKRKVLLGKSEQKALGCLFVVAAYSVKKKYEQDYLIATDVPIYHLLKKNFRVCRPLIGGGHMFFYLILQTTLRLY